MQSNSFVTNLWEGITKRANQVFKAKKDKAGLNWVKIKYLKHAATGKTRVYEYKGKKIFYKSPKELLYALKEIFVEDIYHLQLPPKPYIIDCGANIGLSVIYLKQRFPDAEILAFEPDRINFELLQKNTQSFNLQQILLKNEAVWTDETELKFTSDGTMSSKIEAASTKNSVTVKATRLKNYLNRKVDFLKIDIEGAEYQVVKDIQHQLMHVNNLFLEYHGSFQQNNELIEILDIVQKAGFAFYIKEAANLYNKPFTDVYTLTRNYNVQLNIFCFRL